MSNILTEFVSANRNNPYWDNFFSNNDVGLPLAYLISHDLATATDTGLPYLQETWLALCETFEADPEGEFDNLDDLLA